MELMKGKDRRKLKEGSGAKISMNGALVNSESTEPRRRRFSPEMAKTTPSGRFTGRGSL